MNLIQRIYMAGAGILALAAPLVADFNEAIRSYRPAEVQAVAAHTRNGSLDKNALDITLKAKNDRMYFSAGFPYIWIHKGNGQRRGVGDLSVSAGPWYQFGNNHLLPLATVQLPLGIDSATDNPELELMLLGTNAYDPFGIDLGAGWRFRDGPDQRKLRLTTGASISDSWKLGLESVLSEDDKLSTRQHFGLLRYTADGYHLTLYAGRTLNSPGPDAINFGGRLRVILD
ncbi:MAG: hypothetical protein ABH879_07015 [archaeon]